MSQPTQTPPEGMACLRGEGLVLPKKPLGIVLLLSTVDAPLVHIFNEWCPNSQLLLGQC